MHSSANCQRAPKSRSVSLHHLQWGFERSRPTFHRGSTASAGGLLWLNARKEVNKRTTLGHGNQTRLWWQGTRVVHTPVGKENRGSCVR